MLTSTKLSVINNQKGLAPIAIVVLIVALIGGYLVYTNYLNNQTKTETSSSTNSDEMADWKTYTNTEYKYSLKYPKDWTVEAKGDSDVNTFPAPLFNSPCDYDKGDLCAQIFITALFDAQSNFDVQPEDKVSNKIMTKIDGEKAEGFEYFQTNYGVNNEGRLQYVLTTNHNNTAYTITYEESQKGKIFKGGSDWQEREVFDQVISTFKFQ